MTEIKVIAAPSGASDHYQFFENLDTGNKWKASVELRTVRPPMLAQADVEAAPAELAITVTVSPIDEAGKALREDAKPVIIDTWTHTFTTVEMSEENFDPNNRVLNIIAERIDTGEARLSGQDKLKGFVANFTAKGKLKVSGTIKHELGPLLGEVAPGVVEVRGVAGKPPEGASEPVA